MTKKNFHEIICPACNSSFWINDAFSYFNKQQVCSNCKTEIKTGNKGIDEQILIKIKSKASLKAIRLAKAARQCSLYEAKKQVKKIAKENSISISTDVNPFINFFLRIIISGLIGFAIVSLGSTYYPELQKIAAPIVCHGEFNIEIKKEPAFKSHSEKSKEFEKTKDNDNSIDSDKSKEKEILVTCDNEDISKETFYVSAGIYSLIIFILLSIGKLFMK